MFKKETDLRRTLTEYSHNSGKYITVLYGFLLYYRIYDVHVRISWYLSNVCIGTNVLLYLEKTRDEAEFIPISCIDTQSVILT